MQITETDSGIQITHPDITMNLSRNQFSELLRWLWLNHNQVYRRVNAALRNAHKERQRARRQGGAT